MFNVTVINAKKSLTRIAILMIIIVIGFLLWKIPYTHDKLLQIYNENTAIKTLVDIIIAIVSAFFKAIMSIFE